jgi:NADP-dependent 3-hydroxy acid dehydrogenase YdfG|tara:strand:+ start:1169 stop:1825 length:657 start_codon:yes stop_codon:yes gene_type:complete
MKNKTILITGGTSGVGKEMVTHFTKLGYDIYALGRNSDKVNFPCKSVDISNESEIINFINEIDNIDILINNAAIYQRSDYDNIKQSDINSVIDINLKGSIMVTLHSITKMKRGRIININSVAGLSGIKNQSLYSASKAGLKVFMDSLSQELIEKGILISNIHPGGINTELWNSGNKYPGDVTKLLDPTDIINTVDYIIGLSDNVVVKDITIFPTNEWH